MTPVERREKLRARRRFDRQFEALGDTMPVLRGPLGHIRARGWWIVRLPLAILLFFGGFLAILPVFGLWMIPLSLLLLAIDLPLLRAPVTAVTILGRRRLTLLWRWARDWWRARRG